MSQTTKRALSASLKALLSQRCLDNITVKDIVEDCEVNRQTFYYHFQDIYDLLRWTFEQEAERLLAGKKDTDTWQEGFLSTFRYVLANRSTCSAPAGGTTWTAIFTQWSTSSCTT